VNLHHGWARKGPNRVSGPTGDAKSGCHPPKGFHRCAIGAAEVARGARGLRL